MTRIPFALRVFEWGKFRYMQLLLINLKKAKIPVSSASMLTYPYYYLWISIAIEVSYPRRPKFARYFTGFVQNHVVSALHFEIYTVDWVWTFRTKLLLRYCYI